MGQGDHTISAEFLCVQFNMYCLKYEKKIRLEHEGHGGSRSTMIF